MVVTLIGASHVPGLLSPVRGLLAACCLLLIHPFEDQLVVWGSTSADENSSLSATSGNKLVFRSVQPSTEQLLTVDPVLAYACERFVACGVCDHWSELMDVCDLRLLLPVIGGDHWGELRDATSSSGECSFVQCATLSKPSPETCIKLVTDKNFVPSEASDGGGNEQLPAGIETALVKSIQTADSTREDTAVASNDDLYTAATMRGLTIQQQHRWMLSENSPDGIDPAIDHIARNGLVLIGSSETRRIYGLLVAYFEKSNHTAYVEFQIASRFAEDHVASAKMCREKSSDFIKWHRPGMKCSEATHKIELSYTRNDYHLHFIWNTKLEPSSGVLQSLKARISQCPKPTVFHGVPMAHVLYTPSVQQNQFFCSALGNSLPSQFEKHVYHLTEQFVTQVREMASTALIGLGHSYCYHRGINTRMEPSLTTSADLVEFMNECCDTPRVMVSPKTCACHAQFTDGVLRVPQWDETSPITGSAKWTTRCDAYLQSNHGMQNANKILTKLAKSMHIQPVDMFQTTTAATLGPPLDDQCIRTHWPYDVIVLQINKIVQATKKSASTNGQPEPAFAATTTVGSSNEKAVVQPTAKAESETDTKVPIITAAPTIFTTAHRTILDPTKGRFVITSTELLTNIDNSTGAVGAAIAHYSGVTHRLQNHKALLINLHITHHAGTTLCMWARSQHGSHYPSGGPGGGAGAVNNGCMMADLRETAPWNDCPMCNYAAPLTHAITHAFLDAVRYVAYDISQVHLFSAKANNFV